MQTTHFDHIVLACGKQAVAMRITLDDFERITACQQMTSECDVLNRLRK